MKKVTLKDIFKYSALALFMSTTLTACGNDDDPIDTPIVEEDSTGDSSSDDSGSDDSGSDDSGSDDSGSDDSGSDDSGSDDSGSDDSGDTTPPVITLNGDAYVKVPTSNVASAFYTDPGATASDDVDGNLDGDIIVSGAEFVDVLTPGTYQVTYNVSDAAGNEATEVVRTVRVENYGGKDTSFNGSGVKYTDVAYDIGEKVLQDSSGNVYAIGTNDGSSVFVRKYTSTGAVDTTYGKSGAFTYEVDDDVSSEAIDAVIDDSDNLLIAIRGWTSAGLLQVIKLKPDTSLDSNFGTDGVAEVDLPNSNSGLSAMSVDSQGNIFVTGTHLGEVRAPFITKFTAGGSVDTDFGTDGTYIMSVTKSSYASDIAVTANDNLVLVGHESGVTQWTMAVWQVSASGTLDTNFGDNGVVTYIYSSSYPNYYANGTLGKSITVDTEGNIIAAGEGVKSTNQRDVIVMKLTSDGSLDPDFPTTTRYTNVNTSVVNAVRDVVVGDDGIIYIAGGAGTTAAENQQDKGYIVAFTATGTPAYNFDSGFVVYDMISGKRDNFISLLLDETNNHILVLGYAYKDNTIEDTAFVLKLKN